MEAFIFKIYSDVAHIYNKSMELLCKHVIFTHNNDQPASVINDTLFNYFNVPLMEYKLMDLVINTDDNTLNYPFKFLDKIKPLDLLTHRFIFKVEISVFIAAKPTFV